MIQMHIYGILALLEVFVLVSGVALYLYLRNRKQNLTISRLQSSLNEKPAAPQPEIIEVEKQVAAPDVETQSYSDFLREELDASNILLGSGGGSSGEGEEEEGDSEGELVRHMLAARHQFLQLELDAQAMGKDPEAKRRHIVEQMQGLLATLNSLRSEPEPEAEPDVEEGTDEATLAREKQLESQISHLRNVINNQQDVMRELRELLEKEMGDSEELRAIVSKLQDAEARSIELERSLEVMEKDAAEFAAHSSRESDYDSTPDSDMLRDLVGSQQQTINNLQMMLRKSVDDTNASVELRDAIEKIQRSNQELGTCVMVLEDENTMLRDQIESLHAQLENFMGGAEEGDEEMPTSSEVQSEIEALPDEAVAEAVEVTQAQETEAAAPADTEVSEAVMDSEPQAETAEESSPPTGTADTEAVPEPEQTEPRVAEDVIASADDRKTPPADAAVDIDALLEAEATPVADAPAETPDATGSEPVVDDIDALLDEVAASDNTEAVAESPAMEEAAAQEDTATDEDVDALLDAVQTDAEPADQPETETKAEQSKDDGGINTLKDIDLAGDEQEDLSDDEIEALLSGQNKS